MARRLLKIRRLLAATVVILSVLVALILFGVHTPPVRRYVARQVISRLEQRETRDEPLDASRGAFLSQLIGFSQSWLGSDMPYWKYLGQYFHYFPLQAPQQKPLTNEVLRFLIRGDYGVVLDRRPGEPRSRFYFSIGQAF